MLKHEVTRIKRSSGEMQTGTSLFALGRPVKASLSFPPRVTAGGTWCRPGGGPLHPPIRVTSPRVLLGRGLCGNGAPCLLRSVLVVLRPLGKITGPRCDFLEPKQALAAFWCVQVCFGTSSNRHEKFLLPMKQSVPIFTARARWQTKANS